MFRVLGRLAVVGAMVFGAGLVAPGVAGAGPAALGANRSDRAPCGQQRGVPGLRIIAPNDPRIYLIDGSGLKRWIPTEADYFRLFDNGDGIVTTEATRCIEEGVPLVDTRLIKIIGHPEIYIIDTVFKRWIPNEATFNKYHFSWTRVQMVDSDSHWTGPDWN